MRCWVHRSEQNTGGILPFRADILVCQGGGGKTDKQDQGANYTVPLIISSMGKRISKRRQGVTGLSV